VRTQSEPVLRQWLRAIELWVRRALRTRSSPKPTILESHYGSRVARYRLASDAPGVIAVWRIVQADAKSDLLLCLVNLAQLRETIGRTAESRGSTAATAHWDNPLSREIKKFLRTKDNREIDATHLFVVSWISKTPIARLDGNGRTIYGTHVECVGIFAVSLGSWDDLPAKRIIDRIAKRIAEIEPLEIAPWEKRVRLIDWLEWLDHYGKVAFGPFHTLQPLKPKYLR